jgi:hypothetical protein
MKKGILSQEYIAQRAIQEYNSVINRIEKEENFLRENGKLALGTFVMKVNENRLDQMFGSISGEIGVIVGWDFEYNYYRVYYSDYNPYIGEREGTIIAFDGDVPDNVKNHQIYGVKTLIVRL